MIDPILMLLASLIGCYIAIGLAWMCVMYRAAKEEGEPMGPAECVATVLFWPASFFF